jgi:hypothetical protein
MSLQALGAAAERRDRALAHVIGIERGDQRQATALLRRRRLGGGLGRNRGADNAARAATDLARSFVLVRDVGGDTGGARGGYCGAGRGCRTGFGFAKAFFGFEFGLAPGFLVLTVALFLGLAAGFGGLALGLLDAFLAVAAPGFNLGQPPFLDVADFCVGERAGASRTLILGQGAQNDARIAARRSRGRCGTGERRLGGRGLLGNDRLGRMGLSCGCVAGNAARCPSRRAA